MLLKLNMKYFILFVLCGYLALEVESSVLPQGSNQDNQSKQIGKVDVDEIKSRKRLSIHSDDSDESDRSRSAESEEHGKKLDSDHIVFGVKTNAKSHEKSTAGVDTLIKALQKIFQTKDPMFKPKKFSLRASSEEKAKPSVGVEIDTGSVIATIKKFLASHAFKRTANDIAKKAAIVLRSLKQDM